MKIFAEVREIGEEEFIEYLEKYGKDITHGEEYAKAYFDLGNRSYQSNANRIAGTLIYNFISERGQNAGEIKILDLASGPEMLKKHGPDELKDKVVSIDINPANFSISEGSKRVIGQLTTLPFAEKSFDYINLTFALHYSRFIPSRKQLERLQILTEMNRVLKQGGRAIIDLVYSADIKDFKSFKENINLFGFKIVENYTGEIKSGNNYKSKVITLEKIEDLDDNFSLEDLVENMTKEQVNGFKFENVKDKLKDSRKMITNFELGDQKFDIQFNSVDQEAYREEQYILEKGEGLKKKYKTIEKIPAEEVVDNGFIRILSSKNYILFKRLTTGQGGVVIK